MPVSSTPRRRSPRRWPAALAWAAWVLAVLTLATFPWLDRLLRHAGRPDLGLCTSGAAAGYVADGRVVRPGALPAAHVVSRLYPTVTVVEQTMPPTRASLGLRPHPAGTDRRSLDERGRLLPTRL